MKLESDQVWLPMLPFREPKLTRWICTIKISWVGYRFGEPKTVAEAENLLWVRDTVFLRWIDTAGATHLPK
jgi:hypothetical protein